jgi:hypothetical protein
MATSPETKRLTYRGPASQVCYELGEYGYSALLVPDAVYELPTDFANRLMKSNPHFQVSPVSAFKFREESEPEKKKSFLFSESAKPKGVLETSSEQENK